MYQLNEFNETELLDQALADEVATILSSAIAANGKASLAVSGGSTPKNFFKILSTKDILWQNVTITLADERWVPIDSSDSNTQLVHQYLLQNKAKSAHFFHLKRQEDLDAAHLLTLNDKANAQIQPLDVVILGMGEDGHTASLFPCSKQIEHCLAADSPTLIKVLPETAPHQRISFSFAALANSKNIFLHIAGAAKKRVLMKALDDSSAKDMPIRAFLHHNEIKTHIFWAE
jgi:6-phosphogluconolactonase